MKHTLKTEDDDIRRRFEIISTTLTFISQSFSYYSGLSFSDFSEAEKSTVDKEPFRF